MDLINYIKALFAFGFVLGLIAIIFLFLRKYNFIQQGPNKRIHLEEILMIDTKRKLVLVRRDEVRYLILLGPHNDIVIESHLEKTGCSQKRQENHNAA
jgi:flagellar protein FliO/FliZ